MHTSEVKMSLNIYNLKIEIYIYIYFSFYIFIYIFLKNIYISIELKNGNSLISIDMWTFKNYYFIFNRNIIGIKS